MIFGETRQVYSIGYREKEDSGDKTPGEIQTSEVEAGIKVKVTENQQVNQHVIDTT